MKYTLGPWATQNRFPLCIVREKDKNKKRGAANDPTIDYLEYAPIICTVELDTYCGKDFSHRIINKEEAEANATLIASAPDLLEALQAIIARIDGDWDNEALMKIGSLSCAPLEDVERIAKKTIDKVEGKK